MRGIVMVQPVTRRLAAISLCALALGAFSTPASAQPTPAGADAGHAFRVIGHTVIAAIGTSRAGDAIDTIGNSLALLGARYKLEQSELEDADKKGAELTSTHSEEPLPALSEEVVDPSTLPPASAGSNGTTVPHAHGNAEIVAHSRDLGGESTSILLNGVALAPPDAPEAVKNVINAANTLVGQPYVWGGGHASWYSNGYDCSGSVSFALFGGGMIPRPLTSGDLEGWGAPGPGKWITVYANAGHTFAEIAGLRWDTVGDAQGTGPRWHLAPASGAGFVVRHPPGY
jgi:cell wall-associated NlpC family hydrolase